MPRDRAANSARELRVAAQTIEADLGRLAMSPATSLTFMADWHLREARLALRRLDREAAKADDPRLELLAALRPQIRARREDQRPRRRRYRCATCFHESLVDRSESDLGPVPCTRLCAGTMEPVLPLRRKARP